MTLLSCDSVSENLPLETISFEQPNHKFKISTALARLFELHRQGFSKKGERTMTSNSSQVSNSTLETKSIEDYVNSKVGISRKALNIRSAIGIIVFGWLMKMNYDDWGQKGLGWAFLVAMAFIFAITTLIIGFFASHVFHVH
jgi:hypothetical protein